MPHRNESPPIACTLLPNDYRDRLSWIRALTRDALITYERCDLTLELCYDGRLAERVHELVRRERECCSFLSFEPREVGAELHLTIRAPERARLAADELFEQFVAPGDSSDARPAPA